MAEIPVVRFPPPYGTGPRLARLELEELETDGQRFIAVRAADRPSQPLMLSSEALAIAQFFDGSRDLRGVQHAIYRQYGQLLYVERIHELAMALHKASLFDSGPAPAGAPVVEQAPAPDDLVTAPQVRRNPRLRPAAHAGLAYDADPDLLARSLDALLAHPDGPGSAPTAAPGSLVGLVAPHIDLARGGPVYAHAYKALADGSDADLFVVLGTAHSSPDRLFTATRRSYDTPFGPLPTDPEALAVLERELGPELFLDEAVHDEEHSIELQAIWLKHLFRDRAITMLPVLCSSLYGAAAQGSRPGDEPSVRRFLDALARATQGRRAVFIAAADLSHVGRLYGDDHAPSPADLAALASTDRASLARVEALDPEGFFDHVAPDAETRRICGLTPVYTMLRAAGGSRARLLRYGQWAGDEHESAVTFAAATVER